MTDDNNAPANEVPGPAPKRTSRVLLAVGAAAVLLGGSAWIVLQRNRISAAPPLDAVAAPKYTIHLEGFTVNLADPEDTHFLRVTMDLGVDRLPSGADHGKDSSAVPTARIRDAVLSVLTVCKADVLLTPEGKAQLKKDLLARLSERLPELGVREIYFTEFLVQR